MAAVYICNHVIDITQNSPSCRAWVIIIIKYLKKDGNKGYF